MLPKADDPDFAQVLRELSDVHYPQAKKIVLVMDNLNTHKLSVLYQVFPPDEARRIGERFEVHYTPKHASWLNRVPACGCECELSVLSHQCLDQRIDSPSRLTEEVAAWEGQRNAQHVRIDWRFTTAAARIKLQRLYPMLSPSNTIETDH